MKRYGSGEFLSYIATSYDGVIDDVAVFTGVSVDTRSLQPGNIFFALSGQKNDGHQFLSEAVQKGAALLVISKNYQAKAAFPIPVIRVADPLEALQNVARSILAKGHPTIFGITGSFGKTTTKEFLVSILRKRYRVLATKGNQNSQIGFPLSIINECLGDEKFAVLEMGLTEKGHIRKLVEIAPPDIAMITALAPVHIQQFKDMEELAKAKLEIFSSAKTRHGLISADCMEKDTLLSIATPKETFSLRDPRADYGMKLSDDTLIFREGDYEVSFKAPLFPGDHFYHNLLGAIAAARTLGLSYDEIEEGLSAITLPPRRFQAIDCSGIHFIDDAYNAGEESMRCALSAVAKKHVAGRKIAVIGELAELGKFSEETHRRVGLHALECVDVAICFGAGCFPIVEEWQKNGKSVSHFLDMEKLIVHLKDELVPGDLVLLKGSRGNRLERIVEAFSS